MSNDAQHRDAVWAVRRGGAERVYVRIADMNLSANGAHPPQPEPYAWCLACRRSRPCVRNQGTTDWQTVPVYTCCTCGQIIHEAAPDIVAVPPPDTSPDAER